MATLKDPGAFKTIGELSSELGVAQHILRYWESKFPQLRPLQRAGNRRYYRPADTELARRIHDLLSNQGYTIRGVQKLLSTRGGESPAPAPTPAPPAPAPAETPAATASPVDFERLVGLRDRLVTALGE
ncbi:MerR family transcriptional regulator [Sphingomonas sp.]|uniref:MerR family transcriptional regulator n=1 Tax=Sphingomonas sp. TaxID=28214 RepID=UPI00286BC5A6|nr:MerR family transcriptional regulator [Sphingomonas sp.]